MINSTVPQTFSVKEIACAPRFQFAAEQFCSAKVRTPHRLSAATIKQYAAYRGKAISVRSNRDAVEILPFLV